MNVSSLRKSLGTLGVGLLLTLAGCGSGGGHPAASAAPSALTDAQILAIGQEYAQCLRTHGLPNFPDPRVSNGRLAFPADDTAKRALDANTTATDACRSIIARLPAMGRAQASYSPQDIQKLLQFAQCIRQRGVPEWPDPKADGSFPIRGTALEQEGKSARVQAAFEACKQYWDQGISGS